MIVKETMLKCDMCPTVFKSKTSMITHRRNKHRNFITGEENANDESHVRVAKLKCPECGVPKFKNQDLQYHLIAKHNYESGEFNCSHCDKSFKIESNLRTHIRYMHGTKKELKRKCDICEKEFTYRSYQHHYRKHKLDTIQRTECRICGKPFNTLSEESLHIATHDPKSIQCSVCPKAFRAEARLQSHHKRIHSGNVPSYKCDHCSKSFTEVSKKNWHIVQIHENVRNYHCKQCDKTFKRQAHLTTHLTSMHSDARPFSCSQCESKFKFNRDLNLHMRMHTGEKPYKCDECEKDFRQTAHLRTHKSIHHSSFKRKIQCTMCEKSFTSKNALKFHIESTHEENIFACKHCNKTFKTNFSVKEHVRRTHANNMAINCTKCEKSFKHKASLKFHIESEHEENVYQCKLCITTFKTSFSLKEHNRRSKSHLSKLTLDKAATKSTKSLA